jgi:hypothetical protein
MQWTDVVQGNVVVLDEGIRLPEGLRVTVEVEQRDELPIEPVVPDAAQQRHDWMAQMQAFGEQLSSRQVTLGNLVLEGREALETRA